jgi:hypothetical protein
MNLILLRLPEIELFTVIESSSINHNTCEKESLTTQALQVRKKKRGKEALSSKSV